MPDIAFDAAGYQIELFQHLAEFFGRATGMRAEEFSTIENFSDEIRKHASIIAYKSEDAFTWAETNLRKFYVDKGMDAFRLASRLGGLKLTLGGSSRFLGSHFVTVCSSLLYADTILIPDPVFPWLESERSEEAFRHGLMLQAAHALLHLKPIVDADLPHCPVLVFPSWERSMEREDPHTKEGVQKLLVDVLALFVDSGISCPEDIFEFANKYPDQLLRAVEEKNLLVAPGGSIGAPLSETLAQSEESYRTWRASEWLESYQQLPAPAKVLQLLAERLAPQFHLQENSEALKAHPLICIEQQAYYFKLVSRVNSGRLEQIGLLDQQTNAMMAGLSSERLSWLSGISVDAIVELRRNNANETFRNILANAITKLHDSAIGDIDRITAEICREIDAGIADHNRVVQESQEKYNRKHAQTTVGAITMGFSCLVPGLAPYLGAALPFALAAKLGWDAWDQQAEKRKQSKSLMGILATAKSADK